jgi:hypothetical protein
MEVEMLVAEPVYLVATRPVSRLVCCRVYDVAPLTPFQVTVKYTVVVTFLGALTGAGAIGIGETITEIWLLAGAHTLPLQAYTT